MNCAAVSALPLIQVFGNGKPPGVAVAIAMAESRYASAWVITVRYPENGTTTAASASGLSFSVRIDAESYASARLPSATPCPKRAKARARASRPGEPRVNLPSAEIASAPMRAARCSTTQSR